MNRTFAGLLFAVAAVLFAPTGRAHAQVVIQGEGQVGGVYGSGTVYVQPQQQQQQVQPSPYVAQPAYGQQPGYVAQQQQPVQTVVHTSPTMGLLIPGVIALAGGWLISGVGSISISQDCSSYLGTCPSDDWVGFGWIPIAGPWLAFAASEYTGGYDWFNIVFGVIQGVGVVMTVLGLAIQQEWEEAVYADLGEGRTLTFAGGPSAGGGQVGATLTF